MNDFLTAVGLVLVLEGLLYAAVPTFIKRMAVDVSDMPEQTLRTVGMIVLCVGVGVVWLIRG